jgi:hypothetical protein
VPQLFHDAFQHKFALMDDRHSIAQPLHNLQYMGS